MAIYSKQIKLLSDGRFNVIPITDEVAEFVAGTGIRDGQVTAFFQHTTGAVIIDEYEPGILADLEDLFERLAPVDYPYKHHLREYDFNGYAHVRIALLQAGVTIPIVHGKMALGTHQEILVIDDQVDQEPRYLVLQVMGE